MVLVRSHTHRPCGYHGCANWVPSCLRGTHCGWELLRAVLGQQGPWAHPHDPIACPGGGEATFILRVAALDRAAATAVHPGEWWVARPPWQRLSWWEWATRLVIGGCCTPRATSDCWSHHPQDRQARLGRWPGTGGCAGPRSVGTLWDAGPSFPGLKSPHGHWPGYRSTTAELGQAAASAAPDARRSTSGIDIPSLGRRHCSSAGQAEEEAEHERAAKDRTKPSMANPIFLRLGLGLGAAAFLAILVEVDDHRVWPSARGNCC